MVVQKQPQQQQVTAKKPPQIENSYRKQKVILSTTSLVSPKVSLSNNTIVRKSRIGGVPIPPQHNNHSQA